MLSKFSVFRNRRLGSTLLWKSTGRPTFNFTKSGRSHFSSNNTAKENATGKASAENNLSQLCVPGTEKQIGAWLLLTSGAVFGMICLGGYTRLTKSGLSMVTWKPQGSMPPASKAEWEKEFELYKQFPEYKLANRAMDLDGFKRIWYVEWSHRMLGRAIGLVFGGPFIYFAARGYIQKALFQRLSVLFALGGFQGLIGWWMVKSGLEDKEYTRRPSVSPYRLSVHLMTAMMLYGITLWNALTLLRPNPDTLFKTMSQVNDTAFMKGKMTRVLGFLTFVIFYGSLVAGLDAGKLFGTFPKMGDRWVPEGMMEDSPKIKNLTENGITVQFIHRLIGLKFYLGLSLLTLKASKMNLPPVTKRGLYILYGLSNMQVLSGITAILLQVPVHVGSSHQATGMSMLTMALYTLHTCRNPSQMHVKKLLELAKKP